jgi:phosphohistidine phosphatase
MKYLSILRHAKAHHLDESPTDFERPLTARGLKDAHHMGHILAEFEPAVDWIVASPAQRTRETANAITDTLNYKRGIVWQERIYEGEAEALLEILAQTPLDMEHALIIGHNPGMAELISGLSAGSSARLGISVPTAGLAHLTLEIFGWNQIRWGCGTLHCLLRPKLTRSK